MFIQVITGRVVDEEAFLRQAQRWEDECRPGATGFLGSTSGVTPDGRFVVLARFASEAEARKNSDRSEQGNWWAETEKTVTDVRFDVPTDTDQFIYSPSDAEWTDQTTAVLERLRQLREAQLATRATAPLK